MTDFFAGFFTGAVAGLFFGQASALVLFYVLAQLADRSMPEDSHA